MLLHFGDLVTATLPWSTTEVGAYVLLLGAMWAAGGKVRDDEREFARIVRLRGDALQRVRARLLDGPDAPVQRVDGWLTQRRLVEELEHSRASFERLSQAGQRGAKARWGAGGKRTSKVDLGMTTSAHSKAAQVRDNAAGDDGEAIANRMAGKGRGITRQQQASGSQALPGMSSIHGTTGNVGHEQPSCNGNQPDAAPPRATWLTPYCTAFEEIMGGVAPAKQLAAVIAPVVQQLQRAGNEVADARELALVRWRGWLRGAVGRPYNLHHFTQTHGQYAQAVATTPAARTGTRTAAQTTADAVREALQRTPGGPNAAAAGGKRHG
jgi:uncharacterized protein YdaU (DUF1376 family)